MIAHCDLDAFFASVELTRRPELRGRPVVICRDSPRAVVTTATYEARRFGVHSAMPLSRARRLCPDALVVPPDMAAYREVSRQVWDLVRSRVGTVQQLGIDEAYLDLSDTEAPKPFVRDLVAEIQRETGLTASVGIGPNRLVAKVASDCEKPHGLVALSREMACERFASAAPTLLPGIGPKTGERLQAMGITTLAQLRGADPRLLIDRFGDAHGAGLVRRANFEGSATLETVRVAKSRSTERTFEDDIDELPELEETLTELSARLCRTLAERQVAGRTVAIKVRLADFTTVTRARTLAEPTHDTEVVSATAIELLRTYGPPAAVRLLGVRVAAFDRGDAPGASEPTIGEQLMLAISDETLVRAPATAGI